MKTKRKAGKKPDNILINQLVIKPNQRSTQDIGTWRAALKSAESDNPRRTKLYDLYEDILLDGTLSAVIEKRINSITNSHLVFRNKKKETIEAVQDLLKKTWFETTLTEILNAKFWGHSLLEFSFGENIDTELISRKNVDPRQGFVLKNQVDTTGVDYRADEFAPYILEVGKDRDLGLLLKLAQYVIYKRGNFGDWAQFAEIFGMPFRVGKYEDYDDEGREALNKALEEAGSAAYATIPKSTDVEFIANNSSGDGKLYDNLKSACDEEITIAILGQTMTTRDTSGSGYAQGKIHADVESELHKTDKRFVERILNEKLTPILQAAGFPVADGEWSFEEEDGRSIKEKMEVVKLVRDAGTPVDDDYIYEVTNIPRPKDYDKMKQEKADTEEKKKTKKLKREKGKLVDPIEQKEKTTNKIIKFFNQLFLKAPAKNQGLMKLMNQVYKIEALAGAKKPDWTSDITQVMEDMISGKLKPEDLNKDLLAQTGAKIMEAVSTGFNRNPSLIDFDTPDYNYMNQLHSNVYNFAGAKTYQHLRELNDLLLDENGRVIPFNQFRDKVDEYRSMAMGTEKRYNELWLRSEYNNAQAQAQAARRWKDFEEDADIFPNLEYRTAGDANVRGSHEKLNGIIRPINDPFWDKYYPPNDYGCRCRARQTDATPTDTKGTSLDPLFKNNVGKTGYIFPEKHPYYKTNKANLRAIKENVSEFGRMENARNNKKIYSNYDNKQFEQVQFDEKSGGFILQEKGWKDANEMDTARLLMQMGERIVLLKAKNMAKVKTPDALVNDTKFDFKKIANTSQNSIYQNLRRGKTQARHITLHLEKLDRQALRDGLLQAVRMDKEGEIQGVMVLYKANKLFVHRSEIKEEILIDLIKKSL
jgi:SPP1 gp7 family putative phage head morphogenesis protein